ncbi:MAG: PQQ-binding-like beta-propeller repeat protein [Planctomycetota bacterium]
MLLTCAVRCLFSLCVTGVFLAVAADSLAASDWPRWRGPADSGSTDEGRYPETFDDGALVWKTPLPGKGCSTPIVVNQTIYITAPVDGRDALLALDWSGKLLWQAVFDAENAGRHRNGSGCNASAVSDGKGVFVYFKSGTLAAVNSDGSVRWKTSIVERFGSDTLYWDHGTSPVLTAGHVILARMHNGESWVAAFDKQSGDLTWKTARNYQTPQEGDHGYATPLVITRAGRETILTWGAEHVTMHDATTGELVWSCGNFNPAAERLWPSISTPVIVGDTAVIAFGRNDRGKPRLHGVKLSGDGDVTNSAHAWLRDDVGTFVPSPVVHRGQVYLVRDGGEVECVDPATGRSIWQAAFPKHRTNFYASPVIADGKLYAPREDGVVFIAALSESGMQVLSENTMQEPIIGSPVPVNGRLLLRGEKHLFCYAAKAK